MTSRHLRSLIGMAILGCCGASASAAIIYSDNFNVNSSANWNVNWLETTAVVL